MYTGSLLPKYRGASPIQQAVLNGDSKTGITTMYMEEKMDTGNIIEQEETLIERIKGINPDIILVVAYGKILPKEVLEIPKYGCINVHRFNSSKI